MSAPRFRLAGDGLTVREHFMRLDHGEAAFVHDQTVVFRFDEDVAPESRAEIVQWLNEGFALLHPQHSR